MADVLIARGTGNVPAGLQKPDVASAVAELEPDSAPLTVLTNRLSKRPAHNVKFSWWEEELEARFAEVEGAVTNVATTMAVVAGQGVRFGAVTGGPIAGTRILARNTRTGEIFAVTVRATDTLTIVRGVGAGGTGIAMNDADEILIYAVQKEEGAEYRPPTSINPVEKFNYTEIFETPYEVTGSMKTTQTWTSPSDWERKARIAGIEHAKDHEFAAWFGKPDTVAGGSHPIRTTGGFFHYVTVNAVDTGGPTSEAEFFAGLSQMFRYGTKTKWGFGARIPVDVLNSFPRGKLQIQQGETTFGLRVMRYISPHGDLNLITQWLFGDGTFYNKYIAVVDMENTAKRYLAANNQSRDTHTVTDIVKTGDRTKETLLTECGFEFKLDKTHGFFSNITS